MLGQLSDIHSLLAIYQRNGVQGLAQRFNNKKQKGRMSDEGTWVLENFVCVGQVFANLWADRRQDTVQESVQESVQENVQENVPGLIRGADVDATVPSTHDQVTHDACTLVSTENGTG